jgi:hypothetical protein
MIYNYQGKMVGNLHEGVFRKVVDSRKHKMKILQAYGIQKVIFDDLKKNGCHQIQVYEKDKDTMHCSTIEDWSNGIVQDYGDGLQIFLPIKSWSLTSKQIKLIK